MTHLRLPIAFSSTEGHPKWWKLAYANLDNFNIKLQVFLFLYLNILYHDLKKNRFRSVAISNVTD